MRYQTFQVSKYRPAEPEETHSHDGDLQAGDRRVEGGFREEPGGRAHEADAGRDRQHLQEDGDARPAALGPGEPEEATPGASLLVAEAEDLLTVREALTPAVAGSVPIAADMARRWVDTGALPPSIAWRDGTDIPAAAGSG